MAAKATPAKAVAKAPTGLPGLDQVLNGGVPRGRNTLIIGGPGSGKTLIGMEFLLRGAHQGTVEWRANRQKNCALRTRRLGQVYGARYGRGVTGDDHLIGRVEIRRGDDFALHSLLQDFI